MRKNAQYSPEFKEKLLAKVFSPNAPSSVELARRAGVPYNTLYTWIHMSKKNKTVTYNSSAIPPKDKTAEDKLKAVFDTMAMPDEERSAYCRSHGIYTHHLVEWKMQILAGLKPTGTNLNAIEHRQLATENKQLKRELTRKEKALAEASALLILKKKADLIWGDHEAD